VTTADIVFLVDDMKYVADALAETADGKTQQELLEEVRYQALRLLREIEAILETLPS
jgi:hypothetical protein